MKKFYGATVYATALAGVVSISGLASLILVSLEKQQFGSRAYCAERSLAELWGINIFRNPLESDYWCEIPASMKLDELISQMILVSGSFIFVLGVFLMWRQRVRSQVAGELARKPTSDFGAQLRDLESLRKEGILTETEFDAQKK